MVPVIMKTSIEAFSSNDVLLDFLRGRSLGGGGGGGGLKYYTIIIIYIDPPLDFNRQS